MGEIWTNYTIPKKLDKLHNTKLRKKFQKMWKEKNGDKLDRGLNELRGPERQELLLQQILYSDKSSRPHVQRTKKYLMKDQINNDKHTNKAFLGVERLFHILESFEKIHSQ